MKEHFVMSMGKKRSTRVLALVVAVLSASVFGSVVEIPVGATTEAIVQAIAAADEGGTVRFPEGTWAVTNTLELTKGVTVEGAGRDRTILDFNLCCRGFAISSASAKVANLKIFRAQAQALDARDKVRGGGVHMSAGVVTNCLIDSCCVTGRYGGQYSGGGAFLSGGQLVDCEITRCTFGNLYGFGNAVFLRGGRVSGCDIHGNDGGFSHVTVQYGGAVVYVERGVLERSKVHHNVKDSNPGVHVSRHGEVRNCLVYGNRGRDGSGGIFMDGGTVESCTVWGNVMTARPERSGLRLTGGTLRNSIFWANGPVGGCEARGGNGATVVNNIFDNALADFPENRVSDPKFANPDEGDFRISSRFSPAYGYAVPSGSAGVDFAGVARSATAPTCGALEFSASGESFGADVVFANTEYVLGADVPLEAVVTGASADEVSVSWVLDGVALKEGGLRQTLRGLSLGAHSLQLKVARKSGGESVVMDYPDCLTVRPAVCYVNMSGSGEAPFDTPEKGTRSLEAALAALGTAATVTSVVRVAEGSYTLDARVTLRGKIRIVGEGRDVVTFYCPDIRTFTVDNVAAEVRGVTVNGGQGAFEIFSGRIVGCRAQNVQSSQIYSSGVGFLVCGGEVTDCEAIACSAHGISGNGGGLNIRAGTVSGMLIKDCRCYDFASGSGGGAFVFGGVLRNVTITGSHLSNAVGCGLFAASRQGAPILLDSCVVTDCSSENGSVIYLADVTARNCLFAGNAAGGGLKPAVELFRGDYEGCTFAANASEPSCLSATGVTAVGTVFAESVGVNALNGDFRNCRAPSFADGADGNSSEIPAFRDAANGDYRLAPSADGAVPSVGWRGNVKEAR